jgi:hypothetical protein
VGLRASEGQGWGAVRTQGVTRLALLLLLQMIYRCL